MLALNRLFGKVETRSGLHRQAIAFTVGLAVLLVIVLGLLVVLIDEWKVVYEYFQDGDWSPSLVYQAFSTPGHICRADDHFSFTVE